jgi:uncharacterized Zn finger protein (UPF0148 family)
MDEISIALSVLICLLLLSFFVMGAKCVNCKSRSTLIRDNDGHLRCPNCDYDYGFEED